MRGFRVFAFFSFFFFFFGGGGVMVVGLLVLGFD